MSKRKKQEHPPQVENLTETVRSLVEKGMYRHTRHSFQRGNQRNITLPEVLYVLKNGQHEKSKTRFNKEKNSWSYAIRGTTVDGEDIRVVVAIDESFVIIISRIKVEPF